MADLAYVAVIEEAPKPYNPAARERFFERIARKSGRPKLRRRRRTAVRHG